MGLRDFWKRSGRNVPKNGTPLQIPYIDLQRAFQLFVPQLYYIEENPDQQSNLGRIIPQSSLYLSAPHYFASKEVDISRIGTFINFFGGGIFFGEGTTTNGAGEKKEFLYILLCTLSRNEENGMLDTTGHFLFLGEFCSDRMQTLAVVPQLMAYKSPETTGTRVNPSDKAGILNALGIANQIFLSILKQAPVNQACFLPQEGDVFSRVASNRTLTSLERDLGLGEGESSPLLLEIR